jgi:hypothetical protein
MAKAKKVKAKKTKKTKKSVVKTAKKSKQPSATRKKPVTAPMQSVVQFVKMLINQGDAERFESLAQEAGAVITFDDHATAFVKTFLNDNQHVRLTMARAVRDPCPGNPFEC